MWDLWWEKWHWNMLFSEYFDFLVDIIAHMLHTHIHSSIINTTVLRYLSAAK
jgi:hypothetical protein